MAPDSKPATGVDSADPRSARHPRRPDLSRSRILDAAVAEFSQKGFAGARVDEIAAQAQIGKRMLYQYFGNKGQLFQAVIEKVYTDIWEAEASLDLQNLPPRDALVALVTFVWRYYIAHPEFTKLLNEENMLGARHFRSSKVLREGSVKSQFLTEQILARGVADGTFRPDIDPVQLCLTKNAICYYYLMNHATSSHVYGRKLMTREALEARLAFNIETILAIVLAK
ncbi:TetR/AcrR family transcriptional regulator [Rhizobium rhizosphaerae]|uniref:TetR/AcrR family transcriptional regulator n=1 Tax=Xaviernesmea rhizosphaerae TaxID=1672749 RepID=UPI0009BF91CD|nr:TetR/AcrR family transcriptional regulator [Xaviernesmea rhizosphaerae]